MSISLKLEIDWRWFATFEIFGIIGDFCTHTHENAFLFVGHQYQPQFGSKWSIWMICMEWNSTRAAIKCIIMLLCALKGSTNSDVRVFFLRWSTHWSFDANGHQHLRLLLRSMYTRKTMIRFFSSQVIFCPQDLNNFTYPFHFGLNIPWVWLLLAHRINVIFPHYFYIFPKWMMLWHRCCCSCYWFPCTLLMIAAFLLCRVFFCCWTKRNILAIVANTLNAMATLDVGRTDKCISFSRQIWCQRNLIARQSSDPNA